MSPQASPGALPVYSAVSTVPLMLMAPAKPVARFAASGGFSPPATQAGLMGGYPVPQSVTTEPGAAGFEGPFSDPS